MDGLLARITQQLRPKKLTNTDPLLGLRSQSCPVTSLSHPGYFVALLLVAGSTVVLPVFHSRLAVHYTYRALPAPHTSPLLSWTTADPIHPFFGIFSFTPRTFHNRPVSRFPDYVNKLSAKGLTPSGTYHKLARFTKRRTSYGLE